MKIGIARIILIASLLFVVGVVGNSTNADAVSDANRLLRVTDAGSRFESMALQQTRDIIKTYTGIISMSVEINLPQQIKNNIAACYAEVYAWEQFRPGIARIFAENLTQKELRLLTDFYSNLGLPPMEIETFKNIIAKADRIQQISADYIFSHSAGCVDRDADLIQAFLADRQAAGVGERSVE